MYFLGSAVDFLSASSPVALELVLWLSLLRLLGYVRFAGQAELCPVIVFAAQRALTSPSRAFFHEALVGVFFHSLDMCSLISCGMCRLAFDGVYTLVCCLPLYFSHLSHVCERGVMSTCQLEGLV